MERLRVRNTTFPKRCDPIASLTFALSPSPILL